MITAVCPRGQKRTGSRMRGSNLPWLNVTTLISGGEAAAVPKGGSSAGSVPPCGGWNGAVRGTPSCCCRGRTTRATNRTTDGALTDFTDVISTCTRALSAAIRSDRRGAGRPQAAFSRRRACAAHAPGARHWPPARGLFGLNLHKQNERKSIRRAGDEVDGSGRSTITGLSGAPTPSGRAWWDERAGCGPHEKRGRERKRSNGRSEQRVQPIEPDDALRAVWRTVYGHPGEYSVAALPALRLRGSRAAQGLLGHCVPAQNGFCTRPVAHQRHDLASARPPLQGSFEPRSCTSPAVSRLNIHPPNRCCGECQAYQVPGCSDGSKGRPDFSTP